MQRYLDTYASTKGGSLPASDLAACKSLFANASVVDLAASASVSRCVPPTGLAVLSHLQLNFRFDPSPIEFAN